MLDIYFSVGWIAAIVWLVWLFARPRKKPIDWGSVDSANVASFFRRKP